MNEEKVVVDLKSVVDYSEHENVIKSWQFVNEYQNVQKKTCYRTNKVTVTDKRLIASENDNNTYYRKFSYKLQDIKAINCQIGTKPKSKLLAIILMLIGGLGVIIPLITMTGSSNKSVAATTQNSPSGLVPIICVAIAVLIIGIILLLNKKTDASVVISLDVTKNQSIDFLESSTESYNLQKNSNKTIKSELSFPITQETVEMAMELDNLILGLQNKPVISKPIPSPKK